MKEQAKGNTATIVLALLRAEPMYGYQIVRELNEAHVDVLQMNEGTVYPLLHTMERDGLVQGVWERRGKARQRKYYHLTPQGEAALVSKVRAWRSFSKTLDGILGAS